MTRFKGRRPLVSPSDKARTALYTTRTAASRRGCSCFLGRAALRAERRRRQANVTLQGAGEVGDDAVPVRLDSGLQVIIPLLEQTAAAFRMIDDPRDALLKNGLPRGDMGAQLRAATAAALEGVEGMADFATLLLDLKWFDAPLLTSMLAEGVARLLKGKSADALRTLLEASDDLGDEEKEAALREPLFAPPAAVPTTAAPPPLARSVSLAMDGDDDDEGNMMACLERCDAQTLREFKAVSKGWQQRARRALWERLRDRLCPPEPPDCLDDVVELDVGLPRDTVAAVRSVPNLARLRGYGFRVELKGPRGEAGGVGRSGPRGPPAVQPCAAASTRAGEPPRELLLAAVACAARGGVLRVPVQQLRDNTIASLNLSSKGLGVIGRNCSASCCQPRTLCANSGDLGTVPLAQRAQHALPLRRRGALC